MPVTANWYRNGAAGHRRARPVVLTGLLCLLAGACAPTAFEARPASHGLDAVANGVADPYADGKRQLAAGRAGLAIERFRQALAQDRNSIDALNGLAVAYARLGRTPLAETYLQRALDRRHDDVATLNNYGRLLIEQGRWQEARALLAMAERFAGGTDSAIVQANLAAIDTPRPPLPDRTAEPLSPLRLAKTDTATYRLETMTAALAEVTSGAGPNIPTPVAMLPGAPAPVSPAPAATLAAVPPFAAARSERPPKAAPPRATTAPTSALLPAAEAPAPQRPAETRLDPFIIVANGVGRNGLAAAWRERLGRDGITVDGLANAQPFQTPRTEIRYHPFFAREADALAALLPRSAELIADRAALGDIYVELGPDSLETAGEPS